MTLTQAVKEEARRLGFELAGITTPEQPPHFPVFEEWLGAGRQGEMRYLESERSRQRRSDPRQILPECRSILLLGIRYPAPAEPPSPPPVGERGSPQGHAQGRVASYAWGKDYHEVLKPRLRSLVLFIERETGHPVPNRWYTDTGPVLERDLAQRAGLGWIGKNTCLIHPQKGSYFLLAEVLLGLDLEPDPAFIPDLCGSCTRCLEACPTSCILPDRTLDATRCISYLTIELKGTIPVDLRPEIGNWIFGCDICQEVCPWNIRFAEQVGAPEFAARSGRQAPILVEELRLTTQEFSQKFSGSPLKRARRRGYLRNVAVALGNSRDPRALSALASTLLEDPEPLVRGHAAWAIGQIGSDLARLILEQASGLEQDEWVRAEIQGALQVLKTEG